ncbi:hypothetical protein RB614_03970 [Phytohabitans sp. ZYX-F-186]|uniref:Thiopeptide-type bacteriocin biosynthesis domain-containing protein n=1 Tax=Phytohabitans maris TaxID=3071409 RepID=A0ABU0Z9E3_9ACTN|nr:hypothetical protein [Phytohabitans sp. ZYX-F-186]MDQ7903672.1 hypothetical protein [Phytohabitans sp. ZYX-F-186]
MDGERGGVECFYAYESVRLARAHPSILPGGLDPRQHLQAPGTRAALFDGLVAKHRRVLEALAGRPDQRRAAYESSVRALRRFASDDTLPRPPIEHLAALLGRIFEQTAPGADPDATGVLRLLYASESVELARMGGYSNPAANMTDAAAHLAWAGQRPYWQVIQDLKSKHRFQFDRQRRLDPASWPEHSASTATRLAQWGQTPDDLRSVPSAVTSWATVCDRAGREGGPDGVWFLLDRLIRYTATGLLGRARLSRVRTT